MRDAVFSRFRILLVPVILLPLTLSYWLEADQTPLEKGIQAFKQRMIVESDSIATDTAQVDQAISYFRQVLQEHPDKAAAGYYFLRSIYFKGVHASQDYNTQYEMFQEGRIRGGDLHEQHPEDARIMYWYAANLAKWAEVTNVIKAAKNGTATKIRTLAHDMIETDSTYQGGGGFRLLAQVHYYTPKIPLVLRWPSLQEGKKLAERALDISKDHPANFYTYALILEALDQHEEAHHYAQKVIQMPVRTGFEVEDDHLNDLAQELIDHKIEIKRRK
jgi:tetratricopeptide (TPR) repeat protein